MRKDERELVKRLLDLENIQQGEGVDLGCGPKMQFTQDNEDKQWFRGRLIGVDCHEGNQPDIAADINNLKGLLEDGQFRFVLLSHALEDQENPYQTLRECLRILKRKGILLIICPFRGQYFRLGDPNANPGHKYDFDPHDVKYMLKKVNENIEIIQEGTLLNNWSFEIVVRKK